METFGTNKATNIKSLSNLLGVKWFSSSLTYIESDVFIMLYEHRIMTISQGDDCAFGLWWMNVSGCIKPKTPYNN